MLVPPQTGVSLVFGVIYRLQHFIVTPTEGKSLLKVTWPPPKPLAAQPAGSSATPHSLESRWLPWIQIQTPAGCCEQLCKSSRRSVSDSDRPRAQGLARGPRHAQGVLRHSHRRQPRVPRPSTPSGPRSGSYLPGSPGGRQAGPRGEMARCAQVR